MVEYIHGGKLRRIMKNDGYFNLDIGELWGGLGKGRWMI